MDLGPRFEVSLCVLCGNRKQLPLSFSYTNCSIRSYISAQDLSVLL